MGPFMAVIPLVISAAGAAAAGVAASNSANYQAQVADQNAKFAEQKANMAMSDYATRSAQLGLQNKAAAGSAEAAAGSSGLDINAPGSKRDVLSGINTLARGQDLGFAKEAAGDWYNDKKQQYSEKATAELDRSKAEMAKYVGAMNATGSLISGGETMRKDYGWFGG
jgi:hypothetical protein